MMLWTDLEPRFAKTKSLCRSQHQVWMSSSPPTQPTSTGNAISKRSLPRLHHLCNLQSDLRNGQWVTNILHLQDVPLQVGFLFVGQDTLSTSLPCESSSIQMITER